MIDHTQILATRTWLSDGPRVLAVAVKGHNNDWAAYIGTPTDSSTQDSAQHIATYGAKLTKREAFAIFPQVANWTDPDTGRYLGYRE